MHILKVVTQRHDGDCVIACLAMLSGKSYEDVLVAASQVVPNAHHGGMSNAATIKAAKLLGMTLVRKRKYDLETAVGILLVRQPNHVHDHAVILKDGLVFETDGMVWDVDVYLATIKPKATLGTLLMAT